MKEMYKAPKSGSCKGELGHDKKPSPIESIPAQQKPKMMPTGSKGYSSKAWNYKY